MTDNDSSSSPLTKRMIPGGPLSPEGTQLLNFLGRGGEAQYYWRDSNTNPEWFSVGKPPHIPAWESVYFNVNPGIKKLTGKIRGGISNVAAINCLFGEFDQKDGWTYEKTLELPIIPSVIIASGGGWHCYWLLDKPEIVTESNVGHLKKIQSAWVGFVGSDPGAKDLARVLRVPGTWNNKPQYNPPREVKIKKADFSCLYTLVELEELIPIETIKNDRTLILPIDKKIAKGKRNETLMSLAGTFRNKGLEEDDIYFSLSHINLKHCSPPLDDKEVRNISHSAGAYRIEKEDKRTPTDDELSDRYITNSPLTAFGLGNWRRYKNGVWDRINDDTIDREILDVLKKAKREGVRPNKSLLASVVEIVRITLSIPNEKWDADPDIIVCRNGVLEISTLCLKPHDPANYATSGLAFDYDPKAEARSWNYYLETVIPEAADFLQEFAGLSLTSDTSFETAIWLYGLPGSGRSTFVLGMRTMLGQRAITLGLSEIERSRFGLGDLVGKTVAIASEQPTKAIQNSHILNSIISGESITTERKFKDPIEITPHVKIFWAMNELPNISNASNGLFRRVKIVNFSLIGEKDRDPLLKIGIMCEGPGILNWALIGLKRLYARGKFEFPQCVVDATNNFKLTNDIPSIFISECCVIDPNCKTQSQNLYEAYKTWCYANGHFPQSATSIANDWSRMGFIRKPSNGKNYWHGVGIRSDIFK